MLADPWAIALLVTGGFALFLLAGASHTAWRVVRHWNPEEDSSRQIALENETWLAALLVRYALLLQIFSLVLLLAAASSFAGVLAGAMCAAGAFAANSYGLPALAVKILAVFAYGLWLVLHGLDLRSEHSPLVRRKFGLLLLLGPLLLVDSGLTALYLLDLEPDIVTSCCGVLFSPPGGDGRSLGAALSSPLTLPAFLALAAALFPTAWLGQRHPDRPSPARDTLLAMGSPLFLVMALAVVTFEVSPYIYGLPSHRCPFDLFDRASDFIGYPLYISLFLAIFAGSSCGVVGFYRKLPGLAAPVAGYRRVGLRLLLAMLPIFLLICLWYPTTYLLRGGE